MKKPQDDRPDSAPARAPEPRKRFRVEKLEERVAPAAHYNPQSQWVGGGAGGGGGSTSSGLSSGSIF